MIREKPANNRSNIVASDITDGGIIPAPQAAKARFRVVLNPKSTSSKTVCRLRKKPTSP
jgi:hypothetical protein